MNWLLAVWLAMMLSGCGLACQRMLENSIPRWNAYLGKHKDERIKEVGPPTLCAPLSDGGEVCEWKSVQVAGGGGNPGRAHACPPEVCRQVAA